MRKDLMSFRARVRIWVGEHQRAVGIGVTVSSLAILGIAVVVGWAILNGQRPSGEADATPKVQSTPSSQPSDSPSGSGPSATPQASSSASSTPDANTAPAWTATGSMADVRAGQTATRLPDGKVLVAGGSGLASAELYDPRSGTWTGTGGMIEARTRHTATLLPDGKVLVAGGHSGPAPLASAELYDPNSGTWTATGNMIEGRTGHTATPLPDGKVLVAGGGGSGTLMGTVALASAELYDPNSGTWTATGAMIEARVSHTATLLPNGTVLVAGGHSGISSGYDALTSAELYDPGGGSWTATGNMVTPRQYHTATLLPDGTVLVAGGISSIRRGSDPLASAELYDPSSGSWTATATMDGVRDFHTATLLPDGTVLVAGGDGNGSSYDPLTSAELYDRSAMGDEARELPDSG